jgi:hypothetical protein
MRVTDNGNRADVVMRVGAGLTAAGLVFTLIAILPLVAPSLELPSALWFLSMLTGVGLIVVCVGMAMSSRQRRAKR